MARSDLFGSAIAVLRLRTGGEGASCGCVIYTEPSLDLRMLQAHLPYTELSHQSSMPTIFSSELIIAMFFQIFVMHGVKVGSVTSGAHDARAYCSRPMGDIDSKVTSSRCLLGLWMKVS